MTEALFTALAAGLSLWNRKDARKYQEKLMKLEQLYYEEFNKTDADRDDSILDHVSFELRLISSAFATEAGKQNTKVVS